MDIGNKRNIPLLLDPKKKRTERHFHQLLRQKEPLAVHPPPPLKKKRLKEKGISKFLCSEKKREMSRIDEEISYRSKIHIIIIIIINRSTGRTIYTQQQAPWKPISLVHRETSGVFDIDR